MDDAKLKQGFLGESIVRQLLKDCKHQFVQIDLISFDKINNKLYMWEVKCQERFKAPPFDGHGLPPYQFDFRLKIANLTGMIPFFVIIEPEIDLKGEQIMFFANMNKLNNLSNDKKFMTGGAKKRLIFHIDSFYKMKVKQEGK